MYASKISHEDEYVQEFYKDISKAVEENKTQLVIIIGDLTVKLENKEELHTQIRH